MVILLSFSILTFTVFLESLNAVPKGVPTGAVEVIIEFLAVILIARKQKESLSGKQYISVLLFVFFIAIGDLFYWLFYYFWEVKKPTLSISLFTTAPYTIGSISVIFFFILSTKDNLKKHLTHPTILLPIITVIPIAIRLAMPLFSDQTADIKYINLEILGLLITYCVFIFSFIIFLNARETFWSLTSSGLIISMFSSWAIKVEKFQNHHVHFVLYEYLWLLGLTITLLTLSMLKPTKKQVNSYDSKSISLNGRLASMTFTLTTVILILITQDEIELVRYVTVSTAITVIGSSLLAQLYFDQFDQFDNSIQNIINDSSGNITSDLITSKLPTELRSSYQKILEKSSNNIREIESLKSEKLITELSKQVSHDIRSPLSALDMAITSLDELPEDRRIIIRQATNRIRDIANSLLSANTSSNINTKNEIQTNTEESSKVQLVSSLIESIATEKRMQFREFINITIEFEQTTNSYGLFAKINPIEIKRLLSNLINNSVESMMDKTGKITVELIDKNDRELLIKITDTGKGIPSDILPKLGKAGSTFNKNEGNGLGLSHAITYIEKFNGNLEIESKVNIGTTINITLPKKTSPEWFVPKIELRKNTTIIILDDDSSIHQIWKERFSQLELNANNIKLEHISSSDQFRKFMQKNYLDLDEPLFLMDFELLNHSKTTGLDLILECGISSNSILITSHFEENEILKRCEIAGIKLIPKPMAGIVPIQIK